MRACERSALCTFIIHIKPRSETKNGRQRVSVVRRAREPAFLISVWCSAWAAVAGVKSWLHATHIDGSVCCVARRARALLSRVRRRFVLLALTNRGDFFFLLFVFLVFVWRDLGGSRAQRCGRVAGGRGRCRRTPCRVVVGQERRQPERCEQQRASSAARRKRCDGLRSRRRAVRDARDKSRPQGHNLPADTTYHESVLATRRYAPDHTEILSTASGARTQSVRR